MHVQPTPQRFGRYVLLDKMGTGGMAEVFRAIVPGVEGFRRDLVVKRILTDRAQASNFIEMFVHEARISALLHHPNVVQVFDFGQVDGSYFLAMELLRGRDLLAMLRALYERRQSFPVAVAAHVAHQVALGLGYAHALTSPDGKPLNIIHRDVSPSNIMCLRTGGVKLLDFGIAQAIGEKDSEDSERNAFKGKLSYMAPERLRDGPQDGRVDLFGLGAVLWEMLAGRRLFHGKTQMEKLKSVLDKRILPPSAYRPDVPSSLDRIVLKALARDPDERYLTGEAMADDLEDAVSETRYHSRMLPALLHELFGSAQSSAHIALSMLSPELLACEPTTTPLLTPALSPASLSFSDLSDAPVTEVTPPPGASWSAIVRAVVRRVDHRHRHLHHRQRSRPWFAAIAIAAVAVVAAASWWTVSRTGNEPPPAAAAAAAAAAAVTGASSSSPTTSDTGRPEPSTATDQAGGGVGRLLVTSDADETERSAGPQVVPNPCIAPGCDPPRPAHPRPPLPSPGKASRPSH